MAHLTKISSLHKTSNRSRSISPANIEMGTQQKMTERRSVSLDVTDRWTTGQTSKNCDSFVRFDYGEYIELYETSMQNEKVHPDTVPDESGERKEVGSSPLEVRSTPNLPSRPLPLVIAIADDKGKGQSSSSCQLDMPTAQAEGMKTPLTKVDAKVSNENGKPAEYASTSAPKKPRKRRMLPSITLETIPDRQYNVDIVKTETESADDQCSPSNKKCKQDDNGAMTTRRKILYRQTDLAVALEIPPTECTNERIDTRRAMIKNKIQGGILSFTELEEFDIHTRAEAYVRYITPDREFCVVQGRAAPDSFEDCSIVQILSEVSCVQYGKADTRHKVLSTSTGAERKRRKHSCGDIDCYVVHPTLAQMNQGPKDDHSFMLPEGLCLLRPPNKLVELVAQAINDSPDGMLQVQQVYHALQSKFPYFKYMDKASTTSWRSSIRHALYQKWFRKIAFSTEVINAKGCYWAINRRCQPREWTLPSTREPQSQQDYPCRDDEFTDLGLPAHITEHQSASHFSFMTYDSQAADDGQDSSLEGISAITEPSSSEITHDLPNLPKLIPRPRDPDPMLSPSAEFETPNSQEIELSSHCSNHSSPDSAYSESTGSSGQGEDQSPCTDIEYTPVIVFEAPEVLSPEDPDYLGSLEWTSTLDTCEAISEYHAPLLTPYRVSYSTVPPAELADIDMDMTDIPIIIQTYKPHDEHWNPKSGTEQ